MSAPRNSTYTNFVGFICISISPCRSVTLSMSVFVGGVGHARLSPGTRSGGRCLRRRRAGGGESSRFRVKARILPSSRQGLEERLTSWYKVSFGHPRLALCGEPASRQKLFAFDGDRPNQITQDCTFWYNMEAAIVTVRTTKATKRAEIFSPRRLTSFTKQGVVATSPGQIIDASGTGKGCCQGEIAMFFVRKALAAPWRRWL